MRYIDSEAIDDPLPLSRDRRDHSTTYEIRAAGYEVVAWNSDECRVVVNFATLEDAKAFVAAMQGTDAPHLGRPMPEPANSVRDAAPPSTSRAGTRQQANIRDIMSMPKIAYRAEVSRAHRGDKPFGWMVYAVGVKRPVARSEPGYQTEADAWSAAAGAIARLERRSVEHKTPSTADRATVRFVH